MQILLQPALQQNKINNTPFRGKAQELKKIQKATIDKIERNNSIVEMYLSGMQKTKIAEIFNITFQTICNVLKEKNITIKSSEIRAKKIIERLKKGELLEDIAKKEGVTTDTVMIIANKANIKTKSVFRDKIEKRDQQICEMIRQGCPVKVIAEKFGISTDLVKHISYQKGNPRKEFLKERLSRIFEKVKQGFSKEEIAKEENLSSAYIQDLLNKSQIKNNISAKKISKLESMIKERNHRILTMIDNGQSFEEIIKQEKISKSTIKRIAKNQKVRVKSNFKKKIIERNEVILKLLRQGVPRKQIAKELNVGLGTINKIAEANNVYRSNFALKIARIQNNLAEGYSIEEVAKQEGLHPITIRRLAKRNTN